VTGARQAEKREPVPGQILKCKPAAAIRRSSVRNNAGRRPWRWLQCVEGHHLDLALQLLAWRKVRGPSGRRPADCRTHRGELFGEEEEERLVRGPDHAPFDFFGSRVEPAPDLPNALW
jgi:hypothetical protein